MNEDNQKIETEGPREPKDNQKIETEGPRESQETLKHVLPPNKYKLKTLLLFSDFFVIFIYVYYRFCRMYLVEFWSS
jgi:hypothetical protein